MAGEREQGQAGILRSPVSCTEDLADPRRAIHAVPGREALPGQFPKIYPNSARNSSSGFLAKSQSSVDQQATGAGDAYCSAGLERGGLCTSVEEDEAQTTSFQDPNCFRECTSETCHFGTENIAAAAGERERSPACRAEGRGAAETVAG